MLVVEKSFFEQNLMGFFQTLLIMKILVIGITIIIITGFLATNLNSKITAYDALKENKKVEILISFFNSFFSVWITDVYRFVYK